MMAILASVASIIDGLNEKIGRLTAWLAVIMVVSQFTVVVMRYVFGIGSIMMQESVTYMHAILFMAGAGYTLLHDGHVRIDIFYANMTVRTRAIINLAGVVFFLFPVCVLIWFYSWHYVAGSWDVLEGSKETSGIQAVFLLKSMILVFAALMLLQGISMALRSVCVLCCGAGKEPEQHGNK